MSNEWEVVMKGGKHKSKSQLTNKEKKIISGKSNDNKGYQPFSVDNDTDKSLSPNTEKVKSKSKKKKNVPESFDIKKSLSELSTDELKRIHNELVQKIPNPATALLDLSLHIDLLLLNDQNIKNYIEQPDFPSAYLSKSTSNYLCSLFDKLSKESLGSFIKSAIINLESDFDKDTISVGLRLLIQICLKHKSSVLLTERKNFIDMFNLHRENISKFKLLVWVTKQGCVNFHTAAQVWLVYMLPFITQKCHVETVVQFAEFIQDIPNNVHGNETSLLINDFVPMVDLIWSQERIKKNGVASNSSGKKQRSANNIVLNDVQYGKLKVLYPKIKNIAFNPRSSNSLKDYFASLFIRLSWQQPQNTSLNNELLDCISKCLVAVPSALNQLTSLHTSYPHQTEILLNHFNSDNCKYPQICKSAIYKKTQQVINKSTQGAPEGSSKNRIHNMTNSNGQCGGGFFSWLVYLITKMVIIILLAMITNRLLFKYYPEQHNLIKNQVLIYTERFDERFGPVFNKTFIAVQQATDEISIAVNKGYVLSKPYIQQGIEFSKPYIEKLTKQLGEIVQYIADKAIEYYPMIQEYVDLAVNQVVLWYTKVYEYLTSDEMMKVWQDLSRQIEATIGQSYDFVVEQWNKLTQK